VRLGGAERQHHGHRQSGSPHGGKVARAPRLRATANAGVPALRAEIKP
jgi:hypothetical protein